MLKINQPPLFNQIPDGILFDTDNTLYPYDPAHQKAMSALKQKISKTLNVSAKDVEKNFNKARSEVKKLLKNSAASHSRLLYIQRMLEFIGLGSQVLLALDFEQTYWRVFLSEAKLFPGLEKFLEELRPGSTGKTHHRPLPICTAPYSYWAKVIIGVNIIT